MNSESNGGGDGENFGWTRLTPAEPEHLLGENRRPLSVFLVETKTDTELGYQAANDPVTFFREHIPEINLDAPGMTVQVLRANAEIPFNPVRKTAIWMVSDQRSSNAPDPTAVGVEFKDEAI